MANPASTYRIQFHKGFNFKNFKDIIPYLHELGVETIYASPIFEAMPGSTHGYDITNPHLINPEIGTEEELIELTNQLKTLKMNWLQDIVPNHMAFHPANNWLMDVLENWTQSPYFNFFDIDFPTESDDRRLMLPFLGETLEEAIEQQNVRVQFQDGKLYLAYLDSLWPMNLKSYSLLLDGQQFENWDNFGKFIGSKKNQSLLDSKIASTNQSSSLLTEIARRQYYRLCNWQETDQQINYRRFFTVNSLICLNIQNLEVFESYHKYIFSLIDRGVFQGLRIDHIDGLYDPETYLAWLREKVGNDFYIVVEKILGADEEMPPNWNDNGNTGYDFLSIVNNVFTNHSAEKSFSKLYEKVIQKPLDVNDMVAEKKRAILFEHMQGELNHLYRLFIELKLATKAELDHLKPEALKEAIAGFLIHCPIYRFYGKKFPLAKEELNELSKIFSHIPKTEESLPAINLLTAALLDVHQPPQSVRRFYQRCMQFSGPLMAKGVEDTLMYTYNRFIGHTEVGDHPGAFGISIPTFHEKMLRREATVPLSMNATATHDTKRGEDVRARLNVLTDLPDQWSKLVLQLTDYDKKNNKINLHKNDAYLIYQTLLGILPLQEDVDEEMEQRLSLYVEKALREAKKRSDWAIPNEDYETAVKKFVLSFLEQEQPNNRAMRAFLFDIADFSVVNSLSQLLLKFTSPGIPDLYQGSELWDLSLVDPDNRRPVDFQIRESWLKEVKDAKPEELWNERFSGKVKLWLTHKLLQVRKVKQELFDKGTYIPLKVKGKYKKHVLAFLRAYQNQFILVAVPLGLAKISPKKKTDILEFDWKDTQLILPSNLPIQWENLLIDTTQYKDVLNEGVLVADLFKELPIACLSFEKVVHKRGAGVLMHISSLTSSFGIGDMGQSAYDFVDFLYETKQSYWQLLPLNPTTALACYSPYCAYSATAGNVLFISPEFLVDQGLISEKLLKKYQLETTNSVDFKNAEMNKNRIIQSAYQNFVALSDKKLEQEFKAFCKAEKDWLDNFALFASLRKHHQFMPWDEWPEGYKLRNPASIKQFVIANTSEIEELKWQQFIFFRQWHQLKQYANEKGIRLIGDLPFYVAYDSADVWANPHFFELDKDLKMTGIAGVPPDFFNDKGQLWGMPIFNWEALKLKRYDWWMTRIKKNIELFDILRLDHFRAFESYWDIPAGNKNAVHGSWKKGPGANFFDTVCEVFGELPFVVEDLGDGVEEAMKLRDQFKFPGMKVLQFAFGEDLPSSQNMPHNYTSDNFLVYTGTHDNNTTKGWFNEDLGEKGKRRLNEYAGHEIDIKNVSQRLIQIAFGSIAKIAIVPMQDIIGLDETQRMNTPGTVDNNWLWRLKINELTKETKAWLLKQTELFGRG